MRRFVTRTALALLLCALCPAQAEYRLQDLDGNEHRLSALRGQWVMINFWATWCPPCIHEMPELEAFFHYLNLDVSTLKELARLWKPDLVGGFAKKGAHLALDDILESIDELKYYRSCFIRH